MATITEHHITVPRTARYAMLGQPGPQIRRLWYVLHGYGQLAERFIREFERLDDGATLVVAPEALSRSYLRGGSGTIGASWMTREDRLNEISDYLRYLTLLHAQLLQQLPGQPAITLLGFSQGGATAGRWLASGAIPAQHLILCGALLPPEITPEQLGQTAITVVIGKEDPFVDRQDLGQQRNQLQSAGKPLRLVEFDGGHRVSLEGVC